MRQLWVTITESIDLFIDLPTNFICHWFNETAVNFSVMRVCTYMIICKVLVQNHMARFIQLHVRCEHAMFPSHFWLTCCIHVAYMFVEKKGCIIITKRYECYITYMYIMTALAEQYTDIIQCSYWCQTIDSVMLLIPRLSHRLSYVTFRTISWSCVSSPTTVNADIFVWLIFRVLQLKNIFAGCWIRAEQMLTCHFCTAQFNEWYIYKYVCNWAAQKQADLRQTWVYYPFASTHMVNTQLLRVQNVHTKYRKYFHGFLNSRLLKNREIREN